MAKKPAAKKPAAPAAPAPVAPSTTDDVRRQIAEAMKTGNTSLVAKLRAELGR